MAELKPYVQKQSCFWWLQSPEKILYMLREMSSGIFLLYGFVLLGWLIAMYRGRAAYLSFIEFLSSPGFVIFSIIALLFALVHSCTWFYLAPRAMPLYLGGKRVPNNLITAGYYVVFLIVTVATYALMYYF